MMENSFDSWLCSWLFTTEISELDSLFFIAQIGFLVEDSFSGCLVACHLIVDEL